MSRSTDSTRDGGHFVYLAGAMEHAPDRGRGWRDEVVGILGELGHAFFNPNEEEPRVTTSEERTSFAVWKARGDDRFDAMMKRIIAHDLEALDRATYLVAYWDTHTARSGGTPSEITLMHHWGRPVYLVLAVARSEVSAWVLGCATRIFDSFDDLSTFLTREYGSP